MNKYFIYLSITLLFMIGFNSYCTEVKISQKKSEKENKRAIELIDLIAENAAKNPIVLPTEAQLQELKSLAQYVPGSTKYAEISKLLKDMPAKSAAQLEKEAKEAEAKAGVKP